MHTFNKLWVPAALLVGFIFLQEFMKKSRKSQLIRTSNGSVESFYEHTSYAEKVYRASVKARDDRMKKMYNGDPNVVIPWDGHNANYLWDLFPPSYNCPYRERIGRFSEGGKVLCNPSQLRNSTVFSFGVRTDVSFEESILNMVSGCRIYAFDPSVNALPNGQSEMSNYDNSSTMHFYKIGLQGDQARSKVTREWTFLSLKS